MECEEDALLFNSGSRHRLLGTVFIVNKDLQGSVFEFKTISDCLCTLKLGENKKK